MNEHRIVKRELRPHTHRWATENKMYYVCSCGWESAIETHAIKHVVGLDVEVSHSDDAG